MEAKFARDSAVRQIEPGNGFSDDAVRARRFGGHLRGGIAVEHIVGGERPIARPRAGRAYDIALVDDERLERFPQPCRGGGEIDRPRFGTRVAQRSAGLLHRQAPRSHRFVGTRRCRRRNHPHARDRDVELFRGDLRQRRQNALPDLDFARKDFDEAIGAEAEPLRESSIPAEAPGQRRGRGSAAHGADPPTAFNTARTIRL